MAAAAHTRTANRPAPTLDEKAAAAALHASRSNNDPALDGDDHRLSAAGAATSLKYASAKDLPSYPILGLSNSEASAGTAAHLADANRKPFEYWKPGESSSASKAALLANDYKSAPVWHPELSSAGSKAALLAAREGANVTIWKPEASASGNTAAGLAMRNKHLTPELDYGYTREGTRRATLAATGAMSGSRKRSDSTPVNVGLGSNAYAANSAASAAANRPSTPSKLVESSPALDASRIHNVAKNNVNRELYTANPPVSIEVEEKNKKDTMRAAAVSMAKQLYELESRNFNLGVAQTGGQQAAARAHQRRPSDASTAEMSTAGPQYVNLQEAAQRLAAERLAKIHVEKDPYRDYYGMKIPAARGSLRGRTRRRALSDTQSGFDDEEQSRRIRSEMSVFNSKLAEVDAQKRQRDRDALLAAAQRNVRASMHGIDERVYADTGKASEVLMEEWEAKARAKAEADSKVRMVNHGKIDIGGGRFLEQADIDAVARANVQPTLDEISERADAYRAKQEEMRLDEEQKKREAERERERQNEIKAEEKRAREEEKRRERLRKEEEKAKRAEEKRKEKEEKRKSRDARKLDEGTAIAHNAPDSDRAASPAPAPTTPMGDETAREIAERATAPVVVGHPTEAAAGAEEALHSAGLETARADEAHEEGAGMQTSPKGHSRVGSWLKGKFGRRLSRGQKGDANESDHKTGFVGGAALTGASTSNPSLEQRPESEREVAMAGRESAEDADAESHAAGRARSPSISSLSSEEPQRGRTGRRSRSRSASSSSFSRDDFEEARDQFDEGLAPPPTFATEGRNSDSPARDSKFQEDL